LASFSVMVECSQKINSISQIERAEHVKRLLAAPDSDPTEVRSSLDACGEDALRLFNYDYYYLNVLSLYGDFLRIGEVQRIAMACNTFRLWQRWESFADAAQSFAVVQQRGPEAGMRLRGWNVAQLHKLMEAGRGLIVCTGHWGAFRYIF